MKQLHINIDITTTISSTAFGDPIGISATVPLCTKLACGFPLPCSPTGCTTPESLEKWQSHCSEKVNFIDFSKGVPKSRNAKFAPRCSENAGFAENVRFFAAGGAQPAAIA